jgi:hypothetical protein
MPTFEVFTGRGTAVTKTPVVGILASGTLSVNAPAFELMGRPEAVELVYDPNERIVGMRPTSPEAPHAYRVRKEGHAASYSVAGKAFCDYYGIPMKPSRRYPAQMYGDVLGVDLKQEGDKSILPSGRGRPRAQANGEAT